MANKQILFIHHDQRGKLSHHNAIKAWTHVSRRSWQEKPKQLTIKVWNPRGNAFEEEEEESWSTDQDTVMVPYDRLQQAYASTKCLPYIVPPDEISAFDLTVFSMDEQSLKAAYQQTKEYPKDIRFMVDKAQCDMQMMREAFNLGIDCLVGQRSSRAFKFFEYGFQMLGKLLSTRLIDVVDTTIYCMLGFLCYAQTNNIHDIHQSFLRYTMARAAITGGVSHPIAVFARYVHNLAFEIRSDGVHALFRILTDREIVGFLSEYDRRFIDFHYLILSHDKIPLDIVERAYEEFCVEVQPDINSVDGRQTYQYFSGQMADRYIQNGRFAETVTTLSHVPADYEEYVARSYIPTYPPSAPLSITNVIYQLTVLAQAYSALDDSTSADATFQLAISACDRYFTPDQFVPLYTLCQYSIFLSGQNRRDQLQYVDQKLDLSLDLSKLTLGS